MKTNIICSACSVALNDKNWYASSQKKNDHICKGCNHKRTRSWREANPDKARAISIRHHRKQGEQSFDKNHECSLFLGVHIAERVLSKVFKDVERMPNGNPGYDFICNRGKKIDVKSSCQRKDGGWLFHITHNTTADYFLCLAFDNRNDLTPLYAWLLPGKEFNHLVCAGIRQSTIHRWDEYKLNTKKVSTCCDILRDI